jgi:xanthine dehydrogenase accessory factor
MNGFDELEPLLTALGALRTDGRRAALVTLTQTRGATFRHVGTRMLVREDGSTVCELSGGCPQNDIIAQARDAIASGQVGRVRYDDESGLDVLMEMGCGGELEVLVEPLDGASDLTYAEALAACIERRREGRLATVFAHEGETIPVRHAVWCGDELMHDGIADASLMAALLPRLQNLPARPASEMVTAAHGRYEVLIERIPPPHALVVVGSSTTAQALLPLALQLGWPTTLVDFDPERLRHVSEPEGIRKVCAPPSALLEAVRPDAATSVVVMTHHLHKDAEYLAVLRDVPLAYVGLLGARGRVRRVVELAEVADMDIHGPVGLDIGAQSPVEIAMSIIAEILANYRGRQGEALRTRDGTGS